MVRESNKRDIEYARTTNMPQENQKSTYNWLTKTRDLATKKYNYQINKQSDVPKFLIKHRKEDKVICQFIKHSGYLENYKIEIENNPHMYDINAFITRYPEDLLEAIIGEFQREPSVINRFTENYLTSIKNYENTSLKYYKLEVNLYKTLLSISMSRLIMLSDIYMRYVIQNLKQHNEIIINIQFYLDELKNIKIQKYNL